jgi:phosphatidate cytidylyltransferase
MLIQRVITALVLLPLLIGAIAYLPPAGLYAVFCGAGLIAAWEWAGLMGPAGTRVPVRIAFVASCAVAMLLGWFLRAHAVWVCVAAALWWIVAVALVRGYPENFARARPGLPAMWLIGMLMVVPTMLGLWMLHAMPNGPWRVFFLFFLIFAADTGAYLAGKNFGKRKLAPSVSPGKTVEGLIGGLLLCAAWCACAGPLVFQLDRPQHIVLLVVLGLVVAAFSVLGDLCESMFKRAAGVKDSGTILPGHGGMLDRVDSILAGAPIMALGLSVLSL